MTSYISRSATYANSSPAEPVRWLLLLLQLPSITSRRGMDLKPPLVAVVIPTRFRPQLLLRAISSALGQTVSDIEVVVVIDGPDLETGAALQTIDDPRLRVVALSENHGGSEARNIGVREAGAEWIALLDDDDEWYPNKIEKQLAIAKELPGNRVLVACQYYDEQGTSRLLRPRRFPRPDQAISDFLYSEVSLLGTIEGFPQTSTWFVKRDFLLEVPFRKGLKRNQDTDWVLRALRLPGVNISLVPEPLSIFHNEIKRARITQAQDWRDSYNWAMTNRELFSPTALSCFLAIMCVNYACKAGTQWSALRVLFHDCRKYGRLTPKVGWLFLLYGFIYPCIRQFISPERRKALLYHTSVRGKASL
jgi:glycosyltransferase involved in cell wall biosynthesis